MRIAIVSQFSSPGGGARFLRGLCLGLLNQPGVAEIGLFIDSEAASRDGFLSLLPPSERITIHLMDSSGDLVGAPVRTPTGALRRLREWARSQPAIVGVYRFLRHRALQPPAVAVLSRVTLSDRVVEAIGDFVRGAFDRRRAPPPCLR